MPLAPRKLPLAIWARIPEPLLPRGCSTAALALATTHITSFICSSVPALIGGESGAAGWRAGAVVSYGVSGWAWERKGKPRVLKETLRLLAISLVVGIVVTEASRFGYR